MRGQRPSAVYVHIPFCERKCHYCAFNSQAGTTADLQTHYVGALLTEFEHHGSGLAPTTVYVGGGTPTSLAPELLKELLLGIDRVIDGRNLLEWTVEVNPGTVDDAILRTLAGSSVNRVSMGVQTFSPARLKLLGRIHTPEDVTATVESLRKAGLVNVNLDLIYGLPEQTLSEWEDDVARVLDHDPEHISLYALQYEEGTVFESARRRGRLHEVPEELTLEMFHLARARLSERGYELYEISNFCKPGRESRHNQAYWRNEPYLGVGAGAWSYVSRVRSLNELGTERYIERIEASKSAAHECYVIGDLEEFTETLLTGLRTREGVDLDRLRNATGLDPRVTHPKWVQELVERGLARFENGHLSLSTEGLWVLDSVMEPFLESAPRGVAERVPVSMEDGG